MRLAALLGIMACIPWAAFASVDSSTVTVTVQGDRARDIRLDRTAAATAVEVPAQRSVFDDVGSLLERVPGVTVSRVGATGSFVGASIRGADFDHTEVFIGDVPVSGQDAGAFDLSLLPLDAFSRVEVYRGGAPAWLSAGAIGGVVRLVPYRAPSKAAKAEVMGGSFGTAGVAGRASVLERKWRVSAGGGYRTAANDFPFDDPNQTPFRPSDDVEGETYPNASVDEAFGTGHAELDTRSGRFTLTGLGVHRQQGEPGAAPVPAASARRERTFGFVAGGWSHTLHPGGQPLDLLVALGGGIQADALRDPAGELGLPSDTDDRFFGSTARIAARQQITPWLEVTGVGTGRYDGAERSNQAASIQIPDSQRWVAAGSAELHLHGEWMGWSWGLRPSARVEATGGQVSERDLFDARTESISGSYGTWRVGLEVGPRDDLKLLAAASSGVRLPTLFELFGDRARFLASPDLQPERATTVEGGLRADPRFGPLRTELDLRAYAGRSEDLIRLIQNAGRRLKFQNAGAARRWGVEAGLRLALRWWSLWGAMQYVEVTDEATGLRVPFRPALTGFVRTEFSSGPVRPLGLTDAVAYAELRHRDGSFRGTSNLEKIPGRTVGRLGFRLSTWDGRATFTFDVDDVTDRRGTDFVGFPLPGRRFSAGIILEETWL